MRARRGSTKGGCLVYLLIVSVVLYFGVHAGEVYFRYLEYKDAMQQEVRFRSFLPNEKIQANLMAVADSLGLPADAGIVTVTRKDGRVTVESQYEETIVLPFLKKELHFAPKATGGY